MHVGITTGFANHSQVNDTTFVRDEINQCLLAEELGFDSVWITEHHFSDYSVSPDPMLYLSYLAGKTKHIRLATAVIVAPWHDPVRIAEQIILLDHLSGGRAIIGWGRGLARMEYEGLRVDQSRARELFDEIVAMVMQALETGYIEGGEIFKQPRRELRPRPLRSLKGRAFTGGGTPNSMISAAKLGLGRLYIGQPMTDGGKPPARPGAGKSSPLAADDNAAVDPWLDTWMKTRPDETPVQPFVSNLVFVDESGDRAREMGQTYVARTFRQAIKNYELTSEHHGTIKGYESYQSMRMTPEKVEEAVKGAVAGGVYGTPQEVLEQLEEVNRNLRPQGLIPHLYTGGMAHADAVANMRCFARHCLPEIRSWKGAPLTIDGELAAAAE